MLSAFRYREVAIGTPGVDIERRNGCWYLRATETLGAFPDLVTDRLEHGARVHPDRWLVARRDARGEWRGINYRQMLANARAIGQALLDRRLSAERPVVILSGNDLEHFQLMLGAMWAGIPYAPISPAYSTVSVDYARLRHVFDVLTPGLIFASSAGGFVDAVEAVAPVGTELVLADRSGSPMDSAREVTDFQALLATTPTTVDDVHRTIRPDAIAKFLFTSGSTSLPKAVPTTHRMMCSNQQMLLQTFPQFGLEPPVLVDWLSWNHTFGGSHNVGIALYNGGTYYIDDGKPLPGEFAETVRNLSDIAPTIYFNVPKGWEELTAALETDARLRETFFSRVKMYFFAGAGLSQAAWERLEQVTARYCGERIRIMTGLGMTETSPSCMFATGKVANAGYVGLPAPGCEVRLVPVDGKLEVRFRGPHVMAGYWRADAKVHAATFDDEGFYRSGDALRFVEPDRPELGLMFDGRIAEDFKLSTGTFVSVGPLRARVTSDGAPYVQDVVVTGLNRDEVGLLIFPRVDACRSLSGLPQTASLREILTAAPVRAFFSALIARVNLQSTGSASRIARVRLMEDPPSVERGEITDKGSINQRAVLAHRSDAIDAMYDAAERDSLILVAHSPFQ
ncbi:MAG TPA: feruloyl-CoA synthase [Paraburkholderia sp.]|nr:feruloyl-CoA synthase [Paraburkholderia sp.]